MRLTSRLALSTALGATASVAVADTAGWALLEGITIDEIVTDTTYEVKKGFPDRLKNGIDGLELTGFAVPLTPGAEIRQLILMSDMGLCPFCSSPEHGATVQVNLAAPIPEFEEGARLTLRGDMRPVTDPETWQAVVLDNAVLVRS